MKPLLKRFPAGFILRASRRSVSDWATWCGRRASNAFVKNWRRESASTSPLEQSEGRHARIGKPEGGCRVVILLREVLATRERLVSLAPQKCRDHQIREAFAGTRGWGREVERGKLSSTCSSPLSGRCELLPWGGETDIRTLEDVRSPGVPIGPPGGSRLAAEDGRTPEREPTMRESDDPWREHPPRCSEGRGYDLPWSTTDVENTETVDVLPESSVSCLCWSLGDWPRLQSLCCRSLQEGPSPWEDEWVGSLGEQPDIPSHWCASLPLPGTRLPKLRGWGRRLLPPRIWSVCPDRQGWSWRWEGHWLQKVAHLCPPK